MSARHSCGRKLDKAINYYQKGEHWHALEMFGEIEACCGGSISRDSHYYYLGMTYHQMHLDSNAKELFQKGITEFPNSPMVPHFYSGLQRIAYRYGDTAMVKQYHRQIDTMNTPQEIKAASRYFYGTLYNNKNALSQAFYALNSIDSSSMYFEYAQLECFNILIERTEFESAEALLNASLRRLLSSEEEPKEILNSIYLKLACLSFERKKYDKAIELFNHIDSLSPQYREKLLGLSWSYVKLGKFSHALKYLQEMEEVFPNSPYQMESSLLLGICHLAGKDYRECSTSFIRVAELAKNDKSIEFDTIDSCEITDTTLEAEIGQFIVNWEKRQTPKEVTSLMKRHADYLIEIKRYAARQRDQRMWMKLKSERIQFAQEASYNYKKINYCTCGLPIGQKCKKQPQVLDDKLEMTAEEKKFLKELEGL